METRFRIAEFRRMIADRARFIADAELDLPSLIAANESTQAGSLLRSISGYHRDVAVLRRSIERLEQGRFQPL